METVSRAPSSELVGVGASAGGVDALVDLLGEIAPDFPASILVVLHISATSPSLLAQILARKSRLPVTAAEDGERLQAGHVYVAPPDRHLTAREGRIWLDAGPRINGHRPAIDPLFFSLADGYDGHAVGIVLSGTRDDGTAGLARIVECGGRAFVQDPEDARHGGMPRSAIDSVALDGVLPARDLGRVLARVVSGEPAPGVAPRAAGGSGPPATALGAPLVTVCPECGGVMTETRENGVLNWTCHVGHRFAPRTLADMQGQAVEAALWTAIRALEDRQALLERLAQHAEERGRLRSAEYFAGQADVSTEQADLVRRVVDELTERDVGDPLADVEELER
jgi:two-component system, chemotaxis family, protein-glutamate methylesterase/glutaminase